MAFPRSFAQAEFKEVSETLQTTVRELMATKADRAELLELHESRFGDSELNAKVRLPELWCLAASFLPLSFFNPPFLIFASFSSWPSPFSLRACV